MDEFIPLNKSIFQDILDDVPDNYDITIEVLPNLTMPVYEYDINHDLKEVILKPSEVL